MDYLKNLRYLASGANQPGGQIAENEAALSEPVRNCEVGTAEEQYARFEAYCDNEVCNRKNCGCSCKALYSDECALEWSQMPYESEVNQ